MKLADEIKALRKDATPAPWRAYQLDGKYFPRLEIGPKLPYADGSGIGDNFVHINRGNDPASVRAGIYGNKMKACQANAKLLALLINNLDEIVKRLEEAP